MALLKGIESLRLKPYDDQTGKETKVWTKGATIGYGHLIKKVEWDTYKDGITEPDADNLFQKDLSPFMANVNDVITVELRPNEFDALVILAFNIGGPAFAKVNTVDNLCNYSGAKNNNNLLIMNDFKYFSFFLQSKIGRVARL